MEIGLAVDSSAFGFIICMRSHWLTLPIFVSVCSAEVELCMTSVQKGWLGKYENKIKIQDSLIQML